MRVTSEFPSVVNPNVSSGGSTGGQHRIHQPGGPGGDGLRATPTTAGDLSVSNTDASRVRTSSDNDFWHDLRSTDDDRRRWRGLT